MHVVELDGLAVHYRDDGPRDAPALVFANSLGTDLRLWDKVVDRLPGTYRIVRYDKRGHGLTAAPRPPYAMGALISDAERLIEHLGISACVFVGLSIGGMIAQGLATKRPDLVRAMVISNTAVKIATPAIWDERIAAVRAGGIAAIADAVLERWFSAGFRATPELQAWRAMLVRQPVDGYIGCSAAISGTDLLTTTAALRLPTLAIAGSEDGSTPPDLVRETASLIDGAEFHLIRGAGHLPCVEKPDEYAEILREFVDTVHAGG